MRFLHQLWAGCKRLFAGRQRIWRATEEEVSSQVRALKDLEADLAAFLVRLDRTRAVTFEALDRHRINASGLAKLGRKLANRMSQSIMVADLHQCVLSVQHLGERLEKYREIQRIKSVPARAWIETRTLVVLAIDQLEGVLLDVVDGNVG